VALVVLACCCYPYYRSKPAHNTATDGIDQGDGIDQTVVGITVVEGIDIDSETTQKPEEDSRISAGDWPVLGPKSTEKEKEAKI
jgi:hypothetical protein